MSIVWFLIMLLWCIPGADLTSASAAEVPPTSRVRYQPPASGPVVDPYRPPANPYGPGNRGIDIATPVGAAVIAPADGVVTFAGQVGGVLYVVIRHADGIRTTMGQLASVAAVAGQQVLAGDTVGTSSGRIHFGARQGDRYIDPGLLLARGRVWLTR